MESGRSGIEGQSVTKIKHLMSTGPDPKRT